MKDLFARGIDRASSCSFVEGEILALAAPALFVPANRLLAELAGLSPISFWQAPPRDSEPALSLVGFGEAERVEGHGPERIAQITSGAKRLFASLREDRAEGAERAPSPRLLGGLSFRPEPRRAEPWSSFADASFSLPRFLYASVGEEAFLWCFLRADRAIAERARIEEELASIERAILAARTSFVQTNQTQEAGQGAVFEGTSRDAYRSLVEDALARICAKDLDKVVPVASSHVKSPHIRGCRAALEHLSLAYPTTTRFAIERGGRVFLGASPERLVSRRGSLVETDALAGTARRGSDDASIVRALIESPKERREHALVVEAIISVLAPRVASLAAPAEPQIRSLRNVHHLWTPIRAVLRDDTHVLSLVEALHPTPAVSGTPKDRAAAWIASREPETRGWYTGAVGWIDASGDGDFAVAIRAGLVAPGEAWLYAGAGIVEGSDPSAEYAEIRAKQAPMLAALGVSP